MRTRGDKGQMLVGVNSIAQFFGVHADTARRWIQKYHLPAVKMPNGQWWAHRSLLYAWMLNSGRNYVEAWRDEDIKRELHKLIRLGNHPDDFETLRTKLRHKWGIDIESDPRIEHMKQLFEPDGEVAKSGDDVMSRILDSKDPLKKFRKA